MSEFSLLLPFDTDDPEFVRGMEVGTVWGALRADDGEQEFTVHTANAEMMLRIAEATGRQMVWIERDARWADALFLEAP